MVMAMFAAGFARSEEMSVADAFSIRQTADSTIVVATSDDVGEAYPAGVPQPYFWIDANDTTGWVFTNDSDSVICIHTIPSKVGSKLAGVRWLSTDVQPASAPGAADGDEWYGWWATDKADCADLYLPRPPVYRTDDGGLVGGRCVDFLTYGSRRALVFNSVTEEACETASNSLKRIGTVISVYGSQNGGGWFLGGGGDGSFIRWHRASSDNGLEVAYLNPVLRNMGNSWALNGILRHDGLPTSPETVGFNGGWEVLSWIFTSPDGMTHGPGIGDGRGYGWQRTGGQRIAEIIFYDLVLSLDDVVKVEAYLQKKWFGRNLPGHGGDASLGRLTSSSAGNNAYADGTTTELSVGEGETLSVGVLDGGRGARSRVLKTGAGKLRIGEAHGYGGTVELAGGTLDYPAARAIPSADGLPRDCFAHFDASAASTLSTYKEDGDDTIWFNGLANLGSTTINGKPFFLNNYQNRRGWVIKDFPSKGLNVIDMGDVNQYSGRYLLFTTEEPSDAHNVTAEVALQGVTTLIAVLHARGTGPNFGNVAMLERTGGLAPYRAWYDIGILKPDVCDTARGLSATNGVVYINGSRVDPSGGLASPGFQVVAIQVPGTSIKRIGVSKDNQFMGGLQLGELFAYRRPLSETEIKDVSAYLLKKWMGRTAPGYAEDGVRDRVAADIRSAVVSGETEVAVADGRSVRVGSLGGNAALVKTGEGLLDIGVVTCAVSVVRGRLTVSGPLLPASDCELAADPLMHFDPNNRAHQLIRQSKEGDECVGVWEDEARVHALSAWSEARSPWLADDAASTNKCLDFGECGAGRPYMFFDSPIDSARAIYVIWRPKNNATLAQMLGTTKLPAGLDAQHDILDQLRGEKKVGDEYPLFRDSIYSPMALGDIWTNGVMATRWSVPSTNSFELIEVHTAVPAHFSAIACDRSIDHRYGGSSFGDILVYDRPLTEREKVATRNYLMRKWFNAAPQPLPDEVAPTNALSSISVAETARVELHTPTVARDVVGAGRLDVNADATLQNIGGFTGKVSVASGATLTLPCGTPKVKPCLATEGRIAHFDMSDASTLTLEDMGDYTGVAEWRSKLGDGVRAVCGAKYFGDIDGALPQYRPDSLNGKPTMVMYTGGARFMLFEDANGVTNDITDIKTVFWVLGTVNGRKGGFLLGGGRAHGGHFWHRGGSGSGAYDVSDPLTCGSAASFVRDGRWWKDGTIVDAKAVGLDADSWHYLCFLPTENEAGSGCATGFAFDGRILAGQWDEFKHRTGNQNLAEVIFYDRVLTEEERLSTEAYLAVKWGLAMSAEVACDVDVSHGATLDLCGKELTMSSLKGSGTIENGTLTVDPLVADAAATAWTTVNGTFRIAPGQKVSFVNLPVPAGAFLDVKILSAKAFEGRENLASAMFENLPDGTRARLRIRGDDLIARFGTPGTRIVVR